MICANVMADPLTVKTHSNPYWQTSECLTNTTKLSSDESTNYSLAISSAEILITLGRNNAPENVSTILDYLNHNNVCLIGAGIAVVKATWPDGDFPADIKTKLTNIAKTYKTSAPWLSESASQLVVSH